MSFFNELRRRDVFQVGLAYLAVSWLLLQVADIIAPMLQLSPSVPRLILFLLLIGFPVALIMAWMLEITPDGIKKTGPIEGQPGNITSSGQKLNLLIIAALTLAVVFLLVDRTDTDERTNLSDSSELQDNGRDTESVSVSRGPIVAVLPFINLSDDKAQDYISDGLSEDISTALSRFTDIQVIPASMTLGYRNTADLSAVGNELDAARYRRQHEACA